MPLLNLSCVNCSAPLQITDDVDRFACSYCGASQMVERKGGAVTLRRMENAIHAVQRGTDRTAARTGDSSPHERAEPNRSLHAEAIASEKETLQRARSGRKSHHTDARCRVLRRTDADRLGNISPRFKCS